MADLRTLHPQLHPWAKWLFDGGRNIDGKLVVTSAFRSPQKQQRLFLAWARGESQIPANRPGTSMHEYRLAFDMARIGIDPFRDPLLPWLGAIWESVGGSYGGTNDPVHFSVKR